MSSQANIRNTFYDQRSPRPPEVGADRQTNKQTDMATLSTESGHRDDSVKIMNMKAIWAHGAHGGHNGYYAMFWYGNIDIPF